MASIQQLTGMRGVYLVAAELSRLGFIASPTSRSAIGADILATDQYNKSGEMIEYFIVPSRVISEKMVYSKNKNSEWYAINLRDVEKYRDDWSVFGKS